MELGRRWRNWKPKNKVVLTVQLLPFLEAMSAHGCVASSQEPKCRSACSSATASEQRQTVRKDVEVLISHGAVRGSGQLQRNNGSKRAPRIFSPASSFLGCPLRH